MTYQAKCLRCGAWSNHPCQCSSVDESGCARDLEAALLALDAFRGEREQFLEAIIRRDVRITRLEEINELLARSLKRVVYGEAAT